MSASAGTAPLGQLPIEDATPGDAVEALALSLWKAGRKDEAIALVERQIARAKQASPAALEFRPAQDTAPKETAAAVSLPAIGRLQGTSEARAPLPGFSAGHLRSPGGASGRSSIRAEPAREKDAVDALPAVQAPGRVFGTSIGLTGLCLAAVLLAGAVLWMGRDAPQPASPDPAGETAGVPEAEDAAPTSRATVASAEPIVVETARSDVPVPDEAAVVGAPEAEESAAAEEQPVATTPVVEERIEQASVEVRAVPDLPVNEAETMREPRASVGRSEPRAAADRVDPEPPVGDTRREARWTGFSDVFRQADAERADAPARDAGRLQTARNRPAQGSAGGADEPDLFVPAGGGWTTYRSARFGTTIAFPSRLFEPLPASEDGDGRRFTTDADDARLEVFARNMRNGETPQALQRRLVSESGYGRVTYRSVGRNWLVLSGYRGGNVFYEKYLFDAASGAVHGFSIEYPRSRRRAFDVVLARMEDSLRAGAPPGRPERPIEAADAPERSRLAQNRAAALEYVAKRRAEAERRAARERRSIRFAGGDPP